MAETKIPTERLNDTFEFEFSSVALADGTAGAPSLAFTNDQTTGVFLAGAGNLNLVTAGVARLGMNSTAVFPTVPVQGANGTAAAPTYSFLSDQNIGIYRVGEDAIGLSTTGVLRWTFQHPQTIFAGSTIADAAALNILITNSGTGNSSFNATTDANTAVLGSLGSAAVGDWWTGGPPRVDSSYVEGISTGRFVIQNNASNTYFHSNFAGAQWIFTAENDLVRAILGSTGFQTVNGTAGSPSLSFLNSPNAGFYRSATNEISVATNSTQRWTVEATGNLVSQNSSAIANTNGSAASPAYTFQSDLNTGMFRVSEDVLGFAVNGVNAVEIVGTSNSLALSSGTVSLPGLSFAVDPDTGLRRESNNTGELVAGGVGSARWDNLNSGSGLTRFFIYDLDNATMERVSVGIADSGGAGFKSLRIPN